MEQFTISAPQEVLGFLRRLEDKAHKYSKCEAQLAEVRAERDRAKHGELQALTKMVNAQEECQRYRGALEKIANATFVHIAYRELARKALEG